MGRNRVTKKKTKKVSKKKIKTIKEDPIITIPCQICTEEFKQLIVLSPPIDSKHCNDKILNINGVKWISIGKLPKKEKKKQKTNKKKVEQVKTCNKLNSKHINKWDEEIQFYRYWNICQSCKDLFTEDGVIKLSFKMGKDSRTKLLKDGLDQFVTNQKELDFVSRQSAWRNRKASRKGRA